MSEELINKHRPSTFDEVIGQDAVIKSIQSSLAKKRARTFLLTGPSGVGKTTIGRLIAKEVKCSAFDLREIDGATHTGAEAMREVTASLQFRSLNGSARVIIIDECHAISSQAWKATLKSLEEPPEGVYWVLCTTEPTKVPKEVKTRCAAYDLKPVATDTIQVMITKVAKTESLPIGKSDEALEAIAEAAEGSPRQALTFLAQCGDLKDEDAVREMCKSGAVASKEAIDLCRLLIKGSDWPSLTKCIAALTSPPESTRIIVLRYMSSVTMKDRKPQRALAIMDAFAQPFQDREGNAPLLLACARLCFD